MKYLSFLASVAILAACSSNNSSSPASPNVQSTQSDFKIDQTNQDKLTKAICTESGTSVSCPEGKFAATEDHLSDLTSRRQRLNLQEQVIDEVQKSLDLQIKDASSPAAHNFQATQLNLSLIFLQTEFVQKIASLDVEIAAEKTYLIVLGYSYQATYASEKSQTFAQKLYTSVTGSKSEKNVSVDLPSSDITKFSSKLAYDQASNAVTFSGTNNFSDSILGNVKYSVSTDSEFSLQYADTANLKFDCYHLRASTTTPYQFSDRPIISRRSLSCHIVLPSQNPTYGSFGDLTFSIDPDDNKSVIELVPPLDPSETASALVIGARVLSDKGLLTIELYKMDTKNKFASVTTVNAAKTISIDIRSKTGYVTHVDCKDALN